MTRKRLLCFPFFVKLITIVIVGSFSALCWAIYLKQIRYGNDPEFVEEDKCSLSVNYSQLIKPFLKGKISRMVISEVPKKTPSFSFRNLNGDQFKIDDFLDKIVLLNLWASWCTHCYKEILALGRFNKEMNDTNFKIISINIDLGKRTNVSAFLKEFSEINGLTFYYDETLHLLKVFKQKQLLFCLPATFLISADGCLISKVNGSLEWDSNEAKALVMALLRYSKNN